MKKTSVLFAPVLGLFLIALVWGCTSQSSGPSTQPTIKVDSFTSKDGLPGDHITALAFFGGQIWVGTKTGIARYDGVNWQIHVTKNTNA
ncbi:MAG: hypothetical protein Q8O19_07955, partial [Rectinemataceae bacterium]|nr:hypothetical protein [Rectinemataceae bacterium]